MSKDVYYVPVSPEAIAKWNAFRDEWRAYMDKAYALAKDIGADSFRLGFGGGLVAAEFKGVVHAAFSNKTQRHGMHVLLSRGRSAEQKAAIADMDARNAELHKLRPNAWTLAKEEGFLCSVTFTHADGSGSHAVSSRFDPVEVLWFGLDSGIFLLTGDVAETIAGIRERFPDGAVIDQEGWTVPAGYERVSKARYDFARAEHALKLEEESHA